METANSFLQLFPDMTKDRESSILAYELDITCYIRAGELYVYLDYEENIFEEHKVKCFLDSYVRQIETIIHKVSRIDRIRFTPSDFDTVTITQEELDNLFHIRRTDK